MPRLALPRRFACVGALLLLAAPTFALRAQSSTAGTTNGAADTSTIDSERYVTAPEAITRLVTAPRDANLTLANPSPVTRRWFLRTTSDGLPSLTLVGKAHHNLGGLQIDQQANRERGMTMRSAAGLELVEWETGRRIAVSVPAGARVGPTAWSPDGMQVAFLALFPDATHLYVADAATGRSRALTTRSLLATMVTAPQWSADGRHIVTVLVPANRGAEPREPALASGPMVRVNEQNKLKTRTYMDLLMTPYEKALLEYHVTGQLAVIDVRTRAVRPVGAPGMIRSVEPSPDQQFFRATYMEPPFSYILPVSSFGTRDVVIDGSGRVLTELAKRPLREGESTDPVDPTDPPRPALQGPAAALARAAADTGKRNVAWHPFATGLLYAQVAPANGTARVGARPDSASGGAAAAPAAGAARRPDRLMHWLPPFDSASTKVLYETSNRISAVRFNETGRILFVTETGTGGTFEQAIFLDENNAKFTVVAPRTRGAADSTAARPAAPPAAGGGRFGGAGAGGLVTRMGSRGVPVVMVSTDGRSVFSQGMTPDSAGSTPRAFVERIDIRTGARTRIYESAGDLLESISAPLDDDFARAVVQRESPTVVPQSFVLTLATREARQLTQNRDLMPEITGAERRTVTARRADGYTFRVKVTLPAGYKEGTRLPAMFWFYPREYDNQEAYDRSLTGGLGGPGAANRFATYGPRSMAFLTTQGYAVVEPDAPIFASDGQLPNDNYVVDLRNNLAATIDALDALAIIDRHRLGIGGHSYGAFSTVNAMVHTPFFKAGIAGDGAYNRTLTPNGFQSERRDLWQGRQTYLEMSPLLYADQLNGALLLYHSTEDQNVGTDPINSVKLFHALQGLGKNVSLYMYPYEDHGPIAKETVLDQWARWVAWLDKYVKNAGKKPDAKITTM